jgi:hypothetical protein
VVASPIMSHFTKRLMYKSQFYEFLFSTIYTVAGAKYHVSVRYEGLGHYFMMNVKDGKWYISNTPLPAQWIVDLESQLSDAIVEH